MKRSVVIPCHDPSTLEGWVLVVGCPSHRVRGLPSIDEHTPALVVPQGTEGEPRVARRLATARQHRAA